MNVESTSVPMRILSNIDLLEGVAYEKRAAVLSCLDARIDTFEKGERINPGSPLGPSVRVLVDGEAQLVRNDPMGNRSILDTCSIGTVVNGLGAHDATYPDAEFIANRPCITIDLRIFEHHKTCEHCLRHIEHVRDNLENALLETNRKLLQRLDLLSCRTTREKVMMYLHEESRRTHASTFQIPYNRQELADYLCIERSALSRELSRMQAEGMISFDRNRFSIA